MIERFLARVKQLFGPRPRPPAVDATATGRPTVLEEETASRAAPPPEAPTQLAEAVDSPAQPEEPPAIAIASADAEAPSVVVVIDEPDATPVQAAEDAPAPPEPIAPAKDALVLRLESGGAPGATFEVERSGATLGRAQENTIRLDDLSVSRKHARITYRQGGYWLSDLGSTSGTWIDGVRLNAAHRVASGQVIDIGLCRLTVASTGEASDQPATRSTSNAKARRRHSSPAT